MPCAQTPTRVNVVQSRDAFAYEVKRHPPKRPETELKSARIRSGDSGVSLVCLPSVLSVNSHDHRKENDQAKSTHEEPANIILDSHFAIFGFRLSLHFYLLSQNF